MQISTLRVGYHVAAAPAILFMLMAVAGRLRVTAKVWRMDMQAKNKNNRY
jgi:hypothetical protein